MNQRYLRRIILLLCVFSVQAQSVPQGGISIVPEEATLKMVLQGSSKAIRTVIGVREMDFAQAVQGETLVPCNKTWDAQFSLSMSQAIAKGDVLLAVFWARGTASRDETGEVYSEFIFERSSSPYTKSAAYPIVVVDTWKQFYVPFVCGENYSVGQASLKFRLGYQPQTLLLGGLQLYNYRQSLRIDELPRNSITYRGMEPDAPWRDRATALIDQHRKGDLTVVVRDGQGAPVVNAQVHVQMTRHAYPFGSAVDARTIMREDDDGQQYNEIIARYFNRVVMENDLKWGGWENWPRQRTLDALQLLQAQNIEIRGHCLVWPSWKHLPSDLKAHQDDPNYLRKRTHDHIADEVGTLAGQLVDWDVINENYTNHDLMDILGDEIMVDWFQQAHGLDPQSRLYLNDYSIISGGGVDEAHRNHYIETIRYLKESNAPIQGMGVQCHFGNNATPPERIWTILDQLSELDLPIQATEFDINSDDRDYQALYLRDFMTAFFAHPQTEGILMWGFWAGKHWRPSSALWDQDWNLRPHGQLWLDLVTHEWWTDEVVTTDADGRATLRGFYGDYRVSATVGQQILTQDIAHHQSGTIVELP